jgi:hypothetical protein
MRLPRVFGPQRSEFVRRALHECRDRFAAQSSEIRKVLEHRQNQGQNNRRGGTNRNGKADVVVSTSQPSSSSSYEQLSPIRPDVDVNSMFGGFNANNVDPWMGSDRAPLERGRHPRGSGSSNSGGAFADVDLNPRPNFGDDHWSNNPQGVWDIHGRVRNSAAAASSGSDASDGSFSNFYQFPSHGQSPSSRLSHHYRTDSAMPAPPPPSSHHHDGADDVFGAWE